MVDQTIPDGERPIEASDDTIVLANAILEGFEALARSMDEIAKAIRSIRHAIEGGDDLDLPPHEVERYLDGTGVR